MAIRYTRKKDEADQKNTADPWRVFGLGFGMPIRTADEPRVSLTGTLTDEEVATYLDGNASAELQMRTLAEAARLPHFERFLQRAQELDEDVERMAREGNIRQLPLVAMAATERKQDQQAKDQVQSIKYKEEGTELADVFPEEPPMPNGCDVRCEEFVLKRRGLIGSSEELMEEAKEKGWLHEGGTRIGDVGNLLEQRGLTVVREFNFTLDDVARFLSEDKDVIAVVDGGELVGDREAEMLEDRFIGEIPDHAVVVTRVNQAADEVEVFDPQSENERDVYPVEQFLDAWADSCNYLVVV